MLIIIKLLHAYLNPIRKIIKFTVAKRKNIAIGLDKEKNVYTNMTNSVIV